MVVKLKDILLIKNGKDYKHLNTGNIPLIGTGGIIGYVDSYLYNKESILLPRKGTLNNIMYIDSPFWTVDTMFYAIPNTKKVNSKFLYYYLSLIDFTQYDLGSTIPSMTASLYYTFEINLPSLEEQNKIAKILSNIDDQIERNNAMVKRLQDLGNTIYSKCYTEDKKNNKNIILKEIVQMYQPETITTNDLIEDGTYYVYGSGGIIGKYNKYNHEESEVMVSCRGLCGNVTLSLPKSWIIGNQMVLHFNKSIYKYYIFNYLKNVDLTKVETGSVQKQITRKNLEQLIINVPSELILFKYSKIFEEIYLKINNIVLEIEKLNILKSLLLPLLINGQLQ